MYTWVTTLINSPTRTRKSLKEAIFEGMKFYNAKFRKSNTKEALSENLMDQLEGFDEYEVTKLDQGVQDFIKKLKKQKDFEFIGFTDQITYIKETGTKEQLEALWEHPFGSATLLYKVKGLPALIITGPDLAFNDSIRNRIATNKRREKTYGVTG